MKSRCKLLFFLPSLLISLPLLAQTDTSWYPVPGSGLMSGTHISVASDSAVWIADEGFLYVVNPRLRYPRIEIAYEADTDIGSIWAQGESILFVQNGESFRDYSLHHSSDGGKSWSTIDVGKLGVWPLFVHEDHEGRPILSCTNRTLLTSDDMGKTWRLLARPGGDGGEESTVVLSLSGREGRYVCSVVDVTRKNGGAINRFYRQEGTDWVDISFPDEDDKIADWAIVRAGDSALIGSVYGENGRMVAVRSLDDGETWESGDLGVLAQRVPFGQVWIADPRSDVVYYNRLSSLGREKATRTEDRGETYLDLEPDVYIITADFDSDGNLWMVTHGRSWSGIREVWKRSPAGEMTRVFSPRHLNLNHPLADHHVSSIVSHPLHNKGHWLVAAGRSGVWRTVDHGGTWDVVAGSPTDSGMALHFMEDLSVVLGSRSGLYWLPHYRDSAWVPVNPNVRIHSMAVARDRSVLAEVDSGRIVRVSREGRVEEAGPTAGGVSESMRLIGSDQYDRAYVVSGDVLYLLEGFTSNWSPLDVPVPAEDVLSISALDRDILLLGTTGGVYTSTDFGRTWSGVKIEGREVRQIVPARAMATGWTHFWFARGVAVANDSIWSTLDSGRTWTNINYSIPDGPVTTLGVDPFESTLLTAVRDRGLFYAKRPYVLSVDIEQPDADLPLAVVLSDGALHLRMRGQDPGPAGRHLAVHDLLGRLIPGETEWLPGGGFIEAIWEPADAVSGVLVGKVVLSGQTQTFMVRW